MGRPIDTSGYITGGETIFGEAPDGPLKCRPLFEASKALLRKSGLVRWNDQTGMFATKYPSNNDSEFENSGRQNSIRSSGDISRGCCFRLGGKSGESRLCV